MKQRVRYLPASDTLRPWRLPIMTSLHFIETFIDGKVKDSKLPEAYGGFKNLDGCIHYGKKSDMCHKEGRLIASNVISYI